MKLRVLKKPHRLVLEVSEQSKLVHEVWIEGETVWQHKLEKSALAERKDALPRYTRPPKDNDLPVSRAIRVRNRRDSADQRMRERNGAAQRRPRCRVNSLLFGNDRQCLIERCRHDNVRIDSIEIVSTRRNAGLSR